jgi:hypothetical protein
MDEETTKIIKERFDSLPQSVQDVIVSSNYEEALLEIAKNYNLTAGQIDILARETTLIMMGLAPLQDFQNTLTQELKIGKEKGEKIVTDINEKVFLNIRELLKIMNTPTEEEEEEENVEKPQEAGGVAGAEMGKTIDAAIEKLKDSEPHLILKQKMSIPVQAPEIKTDHSISKISRPSKDPYRMSAE